ncbi:DUF4292 domain-containing protein [Plebeiibacterium sediminum]|uniref:DUF4292 domain-containing protein n=1 Tax=Plebeiibacterium sediminum TaxID=2992112 RepID=A0AAE3SDG5_9BACT|nr:DUF4292 domain-containing protein [Plebeiobacterium sediminum]MCW3785175.1 DUF4292 domain-containing protein [Plebeiobacterium sediminum]
MLKNKWGWLVLIFLIIISCKTTEKVVIGNVTSISDVKLRKQLKDHEINYDQLYIKKANFTFNDGSQKRSFKGSFVIKKDSVIIVSIYAPMGIEVVRTQLTNDSVIIVDKHNKQVFKTDYSYFSKDFGVDISFDILQALISNQLFLYPSELDFYDGLKKYKNHVEQDFYSFKSIRDKRVNRIVKRDNANLVIHEISIHPDIYKIFNVFIKDFGSGQTLTVKYDDFKQFDKILFPETYEIEASQGIKKFQISLKINYLEINDGGSLHFKIPSSYQVKEI